jgi:hypothetical protein
VLANPNPANVLEDIEGRAGDRLHRAREPLTKLADRAAVVLVVEARIAEKCVRQGFEAGTHEATKNQIRLDPVGRYELVCVGGTPMFRDCQLNDLAH